MPTFALYFKSPFFPNVNPEPPFPFFQQTGNRELRLFVRNLTLHTPCKLALRAIRCTSDPPIGRLRRRPHNHWGRSDLPLQEGARNGTAILERPACSTEFRILRNYFQLTNLSTSTCDATYHEHEGHALCGGGKCPHDRGRDLADPSANQAAHTA